MQAARGSNNRLDERGRDRANANRLFNSQNNNRGGYNVGHLTYYQGEHVPISWSNQHSAGKYQLKENELVIQFACGEKMRDGTTTNTIPDRPTQCANWDCDTDVEYGRHESWTWYQYCKATSRNKGKNRAVEIQLFLICHRYRNICILCLFQKDCSLLIRI